MNPYYKDMPCPGGCGQNITRNKETDTWTHAGLHDAACPFKQYEPMSHRAVLGYRWSQWKFNEQGEPEHIVRPAEPELPTASVISMAEFKKKKPKNT